MTSIRQRPILLPTAFLLLTGLSSCSKRTVTPDETTPPPETAVAIEETRAYAARLYDSLALPGLALAVGVNGRIVLTAEYGFADMARKEPLEPTSLFRIGSVSKLLTAVTAARLAQQGRLDLDAPIGRYLPALPADKRAITPRQLAGHQGGVRHYGPGEFMSQRRYESVGASLGIFLQDTLLAAPGSRQSYSSYGFNLLAAVMEAAAGNEFRALVREEVTRPLGLTGTTVEASLRAGERPVGFYFKDGDTLAVAPMVDLSDRWPSGGYISTATDLVRFGMGILRDDFLSDASRVQLFTPQALATGNATNVGLAFRVATDSAGRRFVHHGGEAMGGRAFLLVYPDHGVVVAMLANQSFARFREHEAGRIARMFLP
jgi:CubicO group peptidase (beta-lactamase class C family)